MTRSLRTAALFAAILLGSLAGRAEAQIGPAPTPIPWPLGAPIPSVTANDTSGILEYSPCQPIVTDANGNLVYIGFCLQVIQFLQPGDVGYMSWHQTYSDGTPVPPGIYNVGGILYDIGATDTALLPLGRPFVGATRHIQLSAPSQPDAVHVLAASVSAGFGIPLGCGQTFPLDFDALLLQSIAPSTIFLDFIGQLDAFGNTTAPAIHVPAIPSLSGSALYLGFMTFDPTAPCGIGVVSDAVQTTIV